MCVSVVNNVCDIQGVAGASNVSDDVTWSPAQW